MCAKKREIRLKCALSGMRELESTLGGKEIGLETHYLMGEG